MPLIARLLMGLCFFVFGLNGFLNFIPPPSKPMADGAMSLLGAFMKSGYMLPLIAGTQLLVGVLLLSNRFVPLALVLIAPVIVNILAFHVFLERSGLIVAIVAVALELYLAWSYRAYYCGTLTARTYPGNPKG